MNGIFRWTAFVGRLVLIYAAIGLIGAGVCLIAVAAYAFPDGAVTFASGAATTCAAISMRRQARRRAKRPGAQPLGQAVRSFMTEDWHQHHRSAA